MTNVDELDHLLEEIGDRLPEAAVAAQRSDGAEFTLALSLLNDVCKRIEEAIQRTETNAYANLEQPLDSPSVTLVVAALRKRRYTVTVNGEGRFTQVNLVWKSPHHAA